MRQGLVRYLLCGVLSGPMLAACGDTLEEKRAPAEEELGEQELALCSGTSVTVLNLLGISSYQGEIAGSGNWAVSTGANAVRLEYFVGGVLYAVNERTGTSGPWYFSQEGFSCGAYAFEVKAYPMVIDSSGNRTVCFANSRSLSQRVVQSCSTVVSAGSTHTVKLMEAGTVRAWGYNQYGQLGDGTTNWRPTPIQVPGLSNVMAIAAGASHTVAVKQDGTVWAWGNNQYGQLGDGTTNWRPTPVQVPGLSNVMAIAAGTSHTVAVKHDGTVWTWGYNSYGQLGDGTANWRPTPIQVPGLSSVMDIAAGYYHTVAVKQNGTVWAWGYNSYGQLGDGTTTQRLAPVQVPGLSSVMAIAASLSHTAAVKQDGTVWAWGSNQYGQIGNGTSTYYYLSPVQVPGLNNVMAIAAGDVHTVAVKQDGTVWAWGSNQYGQIGTGTSTYYYLSPVQVPNG